MIEYTQDYLLDKQIKVFQPIDGYRASSDAVILSSLIKNSAASEQILDIGSGTGAISLCLAHRFPQTQITGLEIQPELAELSNLSAQSNGMDNLKFINCDIRHPLPEIKNCSFHHVITNPPYTDHDMPSPNLGKATAHNHQQFNLTSWIGFALKMLRPKGYFYTINRTEAIDEIMASLYKKTGEITIIPLFSKSDQPAKRILVSARKNSKAPTRILPGIIIHSDDGNYTAAAHQILRLGKSIF